MLPATQFVKISGLTSEKGKLLNGRIGFITPTPKKSDNKRVCLALFPAEEERNLIYSTYKIKPANISLIEETPSTDFDFTIAHFQQWKKHLLGNASPLQQHPATPPINAVAINEINLSKDDLYSCALHFQHSESGYANGKWVIESALGTINAKSPTGCALMNVEPM